MNFRAIYDEHSTWVRRYVKRRGVPDASADDVTQLIFMTVHRELTKYNGTGTLKAWIGGIAYFTVAKFFRLRYNRIPRVAVGDERSTANEPQFEAYAHKQKVAQLHRVLASMTDLERETFLLYALEECEAGQVATRMNTSENAVRMRLKKSRKRLACAQAQDLN